MTFDQWADRYNYSLVKDEADGEYLFGDTHHAWMGWQAALDQAAAIVLADCVNPPKTEYQRQYNATLKSTAAAILKLKEST